MSSSTDPLPQYEDGTTTPSATEDTAAEPQSTSASPRRNATRADAAIPEATIGVAPANVTTTAETDEIVVTRSRRPVWTRAPSARRLSAYYPERALERGREGEASLQCTVQGGGALNCVNVRESPAHAGFGNAALRVARAFQHAPERWDGTAAAGSRLNLRVLFRVADDNRRRR